MKLLAETWHPIWEWTDHSLILFFAAITMGAQQSVAVARKQSVMASVYLVLSAATWIWLYIEVT